MPRWTLIRHGLSFANQRRRLSGWQPSELSYEGRWQAIRAGQSLGWLQPAQLLCSDLPRARQTACALAASAGWALPSRHPERSPLWTFHRALRERDLGELQGRAYDELRDAGAMEPLISWSGSPPGGESLAQLALRVVGFLAGQPDADTLIVSHAGPLRVLSGLLHHQPREQIGELRVPNAQAESFDLQPGRWAELLQQLRDQDPSAGG